MSKKDSDKEADKIGEKDDGESVALIEPLLVRESGMHRDKLADLALTLTERSTRLMRASSGSRKRSFRSRPVDELLLQQSD